MSYIEKLSRINTKVYLFLILVIAIFLRLFRLNYQSLWYDELHSVIPSAPDATIASILEYGEFDQPPGLFLLLHFWFKLLDYNEFYARLLTALIGIVGIPIMYFLGKEFKNRFVGLTASLITTLNWFHLYYSQEVRFYGLLFLLTAFSYFFFIKAYKTTTLIYFLLYALTGIGLVYLHYFGMFVLFAQFITFIWIIFAGRKEIKFIIYSFISATIILGAFAPWIPVVLEDHTDRVHWMVMPNWYFLGVYYYVYLGKDQFLAILFLVLTFLFIWRAWNEQLRFGSMPSNKFYLILLTLWIGLSYLTPLAYSFIRSPVMHERYTIIALPAIIIAVSLGLELVSNIRLKAAIIGAIIVSTAFNFIFFNCYYTKITKNQFREITQLVISQNTNQAVIFSDQAWHYSFYFKQYQAPILPIDSYGVKFEEILPTHNQVWVLRGLILPGVDSTQQAYLNEHYQLKDKIELVGAAAFLYEKKCVATTY